MLDTSLPWGTVLCTQGVQTFPGLHLLSTGSTISSELWQSKMSPDLIQMSLVGKVTFNWEIAELRGHNPFVPLWAQFAYISREMKGSQRRIFKTHFSGTLIVPDGNLKHYFYIKTNVDILQSRIPNLRLERNFMFETGWFWPHSQNAWQVYIYISLPWRKLIIATNYWVLTTDWGV